MSRPIDPRPLTERGGIHTQGEPVVNLFLGVLAWAKRDRAELWREYRKQNCVGNNKEPVEVAHWVADYLTEEE